MIVTDEALLRVVCDPVRPEEVPELIAKLERALDQSAKDGLPGVGLACPQIGIPKQVAIVRIDDEIKIDLINAEIIEKYHEEEFDGEGCLSFPNRFERTLRHKEIVVQGDLVLADRDEFYKNKFIVTNFAAIAVQHELDHLKGVLLPDVALK